LRVTVHASLQLQHRRRTVSAAIRKKKRAGFAYRRFGTAAESSSLRDRGAAGGLADGAYLQVEEAASTRAASARSMKAKPSAAGGCAASAKTRPTGLNIRHRLNGPALDHLRGMFLAPLFSGVMR